MNLFKKRSSLSSMHRPQLRLPPLASLFPRKERRVSAASHGRSEESRIFVIIDTPQREHRYEITAKGAVEAAELPDTGALLFVFDGKSEPRDRRIVLPKPMRDRAAKEHVFEAIDDKARIVRVPGDANIVYARDMMSLERFEGHRVIPGALLVDHFLGPRHEQPTVFPIVLNSETGKPLVVLQYAVRFDTESNASSIGTLQVTSKPEGEINELITAFAAKQKIPLDPEVIVGSSESDLRELSNKLPNYPTEAEFFGVPVSTVYRAGAVGTAALTVLSVLGNAYFGFEAGYLTISSSRAVHERDELSGAVTKMLTGEIKAVARSVSIDESAVIASAKEVWHPNTITRINCVAKKCAIDLVGNVERNDGQALGQGANQLVSNVVDEDLVRAVLLQKAPTGFRQQNIAISGDANVITVTFEQQKTDSPVFDLFPG